MNRGPCDGLHYMTTNAFKCIRSVAVPVTDQDRSTAIFEQLGFTVSMDAELRPGFRWIEMVLPSGEPSVALVTTGPELPTGIDTGIRLATDNARAARETIAAIGLDAGELLDWPGVPLMFSFADFDGNRFYVSETPRPELIV
jgi:catechol 2,3-dioxygenase-like lactoylglutathione lyase family enzyme